MVRSTFAAVSVCLGSAGAFAANSVDLQFVGTDLGRAVRIVHGSMVLDTFAGELRHRFTNGVGLGAPFSGMELDTYCVEVTESVADASQTYTVQDDIAFVSSPLIGPERALVIGRMYALLLTTQAGGEFDDDWAAGFQIAVWDAVYDYDAGVGRDSLSVDTGHLIVQAAGGGALGAGPRAKAEIFFDAVGLDGIDAPPIFGFHHDGRQDQIVPAPGTLSLAGLGLAALVRRRRR
jgi:uncharacterized protein (TIGR03382 family)